LLTAAADALARLSHGEVGQPDDGHRRGSVRLAARGRQVNLDVDKVCFDAVDGSGLSTEEHRHTSVRACEALADAIVC